jgi:hypothetical protein
MTGGQVTAGTASSLLCRVPAGPCHVVLSNAGTAAAFVGFGTVVTSSNGFPVPSGQVAPFPGFPGGAGQQLSVVTSSGVGERRLARVDCGGRDGTVTRRNRSARAAKAARRRMSARARQRRDTVTPRVEQWAAGRAGHVWSTRAAPVSSRAEGAHDG